MNTFTIKGQQKLRCAPLQRGTIPEPFISPYSCVSPSLATWPHHHGETIHKVIIHGHVPLSIPSSLLLQEILASFPRHSPWSSEDSTPLTTWVAFAGLTARTLFPDRGRGLAPNLGASYTLGMRVIALRTLRDYWERHPDSRPSLQASYADAKHADWKSPAEIKATYRNASILGDNRVVFNLKGNDYRLVVRIAYGFRIVYIRFIGTHSEYAQIDAETI